MQASAVLDSSFELPLMAERLCAVISKHLQCARSSLLMYEATSKELVAVHAEGMGEVRWKVSGERCGIGGQALRDDLPMRVTDAYSHPMFNPTIDRESGFRTRSVLAVPLHDSHGEPFGVLQCLNKSDGKVRAFSQADQDAITLLASSVSKTVENFRLQSMQVHALAMLARASTAKGLTAKEQAQEPSTGGRLRRAAAERGTMRNVLAIGPPSSGAE